MGGARRLHDPGRPGRALPLPGRPAEVHRQDRCPVRVVRKTGTRKARWTHSDRRPAAKPLRDRVLLIGDAAGMVSPLTAGGIHNAYRFGKVAADAIANHFDGGPASRQGRSQGVSEACLETRRALELRPPSRGVGAGGRTLDPRSVPEVGRKGIFRPVSVICDQTDQVHMDPSPILGQVDRPPGPLDCHSCHSPNSPKLRRYSTSPRTRLWPPRPPWAALVLTPDASLMRLRHGRPCLRYRAPPSCAPERAPNVPEKVAPNW